MTLVASMTTVVAAVIYRTSNDYVPREQPSLYYKDIEVEVVSNKYKQWFAGTTHREARVTVYSSEYDLTETIKIKHSGMCNVPDEMFLEEGDTATVVLYSWVLDSTGEVANRQIHGFA